jgi:hypothetical protein
MRHIKPADTQHLIRILFAHIPRLHMLHINSSFAAGKLAQKHQKSSESEEI